MASFAANLGTLSPPQLQLWPELAGTPGHFTLYGGGGLAVQLGHRTPAELDFFSNQPFDPNRLFATIPYLQGAGQVRVGPDTLICRVERGGPVVLSFYGGLGLGVVREPLLAEGPGLRVASRLDIGGTAAALVQKRADPGDYLDIAALIVHGIGLPLQLAAAGVIYGREFNPLITLKALTYFADVAGLPDEIRRRLAAAANAVDPTDLPVLDAHLARPTA